MRRHECLLLLLMLGPLASCAPSTAYTPARPDERGASRATTGAPAARAGQQPVTRLIIDFTPAAARQTADDARFNGDVLRKAVGDGLAAAGLADLGNEAVMQVAVIEVDEFDVRATSNVVLMGRVASAGVLGASVRIRDGSGAELRQFHVRAELPLKVAHNSTDRNALAELYSGFTRLVAAGLRGKPGS